jgi:cell division protein FtsL|tara:strand:- start:184 stop:360 length:177 start_codon:yes stop_codon:yes gene_type:complete
MLDTIFSVIILAFAAFCVYMQTHIIQEQKQGKSIRLPWEKKRKPFDKSDIEYRDGDNT